MNSLSGFRKRNNQEILNFYIKVSSICTQNKYINIDDLGLYQTFLLQAVLLSQDLVTHSFDAATQQVCLSCSIYWTEIWRGECLYLIRHKLPDIEVGHRTTGLLKKSLILWHP